MAKAKKASKATKVKGSKATVAKAMDFKTAIVKEPKAVLQTIGLDISVAYDKAENLVSLGDVLAASSKKQRDVFAGVLEQVLVDTSEIWVGFDNKLVEFIPERFRPIPGEERMPIKPIIPIPPKPIPPKPIPPKPIPPKPIPPKPIPPKPIPPKPIPPKPIPPDPIPPKPIPPKPIPPEPIPLKPIPPKPIPKPPIPDLIPKPLIPDPISPVVTPWDGIDVVGHLELLPQLEHELVQIQGIRKALPKNATKAEKKAAANAEQRIKSLIKAAKRGAPKAVKKAAKKAKAKKK